MRPDQPPIGLHLTQTARAVSRAFDEALAGAGGSLPVWLVLLVMKTRQVASQRELADAVGIREATLTHHLNALEASGLITRRRDPANRRIHVVELTESGEAAFVRLRAAAAGFDERLRQDLSNADLATLRDLLTRLAVSAGTPAQEQSPPWAGLAETGLAETGPGQAASQAPRSGSGPQNHEQEGTSHVPGPSPTT